MKKMFQFMKAVTLMLMALTMLLGTNVITANAQIMLPCGDMKVAEDGRIEIDMSADCGHYSSIKDASGRQWGHTETGYPYCWYNEKIEIQKSKRVVITYRRYLDCYLTDYIRSHDESEWPSFVIKGSDGVPFYYCDCSPDYKNYDLSHNGRNHYFVKYCYDEKTGFWVWDKSYKGPYTWMDGTGYVETVTMEELIAQTKEDMANGKTVNGKPKTPVQPIFKDKLMEYNPEDGGITYPDGRAKYPDGHVEYPDGHIEYPDGRVEYPDGRVVYPDGRIVYPDGHVEYNDADENTLGATVTLKTDCIKVKTNKKGVVAQKPLPSSVKVGKKTLKRNKTFVVSYEKYEDNGNTWNEVAAVTSEGTYRLVISGRNGYEGVYKKRLYVTADKSIKAMSSVSVKVNKMPYTGAPITSGVIKSAKSGKRVLEEGVDYTVTYMNNLGSGTAQVKLTAIEGSGLLGTKTVNFSITGNKMSKVKVTGICPLEYNPNNAMVQNMSRVSLTYSGSPLIENMDFTVTYANNVKAGTAKIVFTGKGLYNGTLTKTFKITKRKLYSDMLDEASQNIEMTYSGKALKPQVNLTYGDTTLKKGTDYTLAYSNNVKVSKDLKPAWITVKGKGNYTGSFKVSFVISPKPVDSAANPNAVRKRSVVEPEIDDTVSGNDIPETDDTVSGNDLPDEDDTVSGNDLPDEDDTVSGNDLPDTEDETPAEEEPPVADDETLTEDGTVSENDIPTEDETPEAEEDPVADDESKDDETTEPMVFATKPIAFVLCDCECIMPIYTYDWSDEEKTTWHEHLHEHERNGLQAHYNSVTYEQALKNKLISEDENGHWMLLKGTLLLVPEAEAEETKEPQIEEIEESQIEESTVEVTEESEAEVDPDKPVGEGTDHIENDF